MQQGGFFRSQEIALLLNLFSLIKFFVICYNECYRIPLQNGGKV
ncbi:hypothetical protein BLAHAN_07093 [Blautia hansenii DSM 20583]|uniref:Uncharacterized protein n=1 Tax=Blautia hansenii DSM 20583 TaxID=537007 RepID=C9LCD5_BLAHA|nr:hypothetical protein BLAHAN_07093 [Blautia hansenii DSM 20583]